jgi:hypothetical protein
MTKVDVVKRQIGALYGVQVAVGNNTANIATWQSVSPLTDETDSSYASTSATWLIFKPPPDRTYQYFWEYG